MSTDGFHVNFQICSDNHLINVEESSRAVDHDRVFVACDFMSCNGAFFDEKHVCAVRICRLHYLAMHKRHRPH